MQVPLVATKLTIPPLPRGQVARPRLIAALNQGLDSRLILVSSPAGYGKTMLLAAWAGQSPVPVCWLSLDEGDNDLARFLAYLAAAVEQVIPKAGEQAGALLRARQPLAVEHLLASLLNEISQAGRPLALVLDDYHLIRQPAVHKALIYLLSHLPAPMHLVIATRADPPLQLARLRARSQLTELRLADLCFTVEEAEQFCNAVMQLGLRAEQVTALAARTEGWIAGLQMTALSLRGAADLSERIQSLSGTNRFILDYLVEEVLGDQPEAVRAFLLQTSILDRLSGSLCDAVSGGTGSQAMIERLEQDNLFIIPLDEERTWYRYHQLFLDLLRKQAQQCCPDSLNEWHARASRWFEQAGDLEHAIQHALAAGEYERAAQLLEQAAQPFLLLSEIYTFQSWVRRLPEAVLRAHPNLILYHAWELALGGSPAETIEQHLKWVDQSEAGYAGQIAVIRGYLGFVQGEIYPAMLLVQQGLARLPAGEALFRSSASYLLSIADVLTGRFEAGSQMLEKLAQSSLEKGQVILGAGALCNLAEIHVRLAQLPAARADYERVLSVARSSSGERLPIAAKALLGLADIWREWNDLEQAEAGCRQGLELAQHLREGVTMVGYLTLAKILQTRGDADAAQTAAQKALALARKTEGTAIDDVYVLLAQAGLALRQGDLAAVERWYQGSRLPAGWSPADLEQKNDYYRYHLLKYDLLVYARWRMARREPAQALETLDVLREKMEAQGRTQFWIEALLLSALAYWQQSRCAPALDCFTRCLELAEPGGYVRLFLDEGAAVRPLLEQAAAGGASAAYARRLLAGLERELASGAASQQALEERKPLPAGLVEPLTEREIELLRLVAAGLSNQAIAARLFISLPTVKWHISNIFGKLGVRSRTQAAAQARNLGILEDN